MVFAELFRDVLVLHVQEKGIKYSRLKEGCTMPIENKELRWKIRHENAERLKNKLAAKPEEKKEGIWQMSFSLL